MRVVEGCDSWSVIAEERSSLSSSLAHLDLLHV